MSRNGSACCRRKASAGFTLPELLLVVAVLAYSLSVILLSFINLSVLNQTNRNLLLVTSHLDYVMENVRNTAPAALPANNTGFWSIWNTWTLNTAGITAKGLTALPNEQIWTFTLDTNPVDVLVFVTWTDPMGRWRSKYIRTLIAR